MVYFFRMYNLFLDRNPTFNCLSVAVAGHSLGSLILFDLLSHQPEMVPTVNPNDLETDGISSANNSVYVNDSCLLVCIPEL